MFIKINLIPSTKKKTLNWRFPNSIKITLSRTPCYTPPVVGGDVHHGRGQQQPTGPQHVPAECCDDIYYVLPYVVLPMVTQRIF